MNERIQALAEQADLCFVDLDGKLTSHFENYANMDIEVKKFAQLIIQECAQVLWNIDDGELHNMYVESLKKHFGVK
jgi:hypothetical protein